jgi:Tfp pilus assembly protein PilV
MMYHKTQQGFSLLETMIASFVLIVGITAVIELLGPVVQNSSQARDRIVAAELSQEGIELVKNQRDNNLINDRDFYEGFSSGTGTSCLDYLSDTSSGSAHGCSNDGQLYLSSEWYRHGSGSTSPFLRKIRTQVSGVTMMVTSYVIWGDGSFPASLDDPSSCTLENQCVFARAELTDWR